MGSGRDASSGRGCCDLAAMPVGLTGSDLRRSALVRRPDQAFRWNAQLLVQAPDHLQRQGSLTIQTLIDATRTPDHRLQILEYQPFLFHWISTDGCSLVRVIESQIICASIRSYCAWVPMKRIETTRCLRSPLVLVAGYFSAVSIRSRPSGADVLRKISVVRPLFHRVPYSTENVSDGANAPPTQETNAPT